MSLLTNGPHTVILYPAIVSGKDRANNRVITYDFTKGIEFKGVSVQAANVQSFGLQEKGGVINTRKVLRVVGEWPGGPMSIIKWKDRLWDQDGEAKEYETGVRTQHTLIRLTARYAAVI